MDATERRNYPYYIKLRYTTLKDFNTIRRMPDDRTLLSLDASLAIPTRVLCSEVSEAIIAHQLDRSDPPVRLAKCYCASIIGLGFMDQPRNLVVLW
jgi:hypothetical protein